MFAPNLLAQRILHIYVFTTYVLCIYLLTSWTSGGGLSYAAEHVFSMQYVPARNESLRSDSGPFRGPNNFRRTIRSNLDARFVSFEAGKMKGFDEI